MLVLMSRLVLPTCRTANLAACQILLGACWILQTAAGPYDRAPFWRYKLLVKTERLIERIGDCAESGYRILTGQLGLAVRTAPGTMEARIYEPLACLILQGTKETTFGDRTVTVRTGDMVLVSHALPVLARVTEASPEAPYMALVLPIDIAELRSVRDQLGDEAFESREADAYAASPASEAMLETFGRYLSLADDPTEARVLEPLVRRELHLRFLTADNGSMLRDLLERNSYARNISRALDILRNEFRTRLEVAQLAQSVGMSASSFHRHFRTVTSTTPLQYQKDLRLTEARKLLIGGEHSVSAVGFEVGYESPSQFSREYSRKFGAPPNSDVARAS